MIYQYGEYYYEVTHSLPDFLWPCLNILCDILVFFGVSKLSILHWLHFNVKEIERSQVNTVPRDIELFQNYDGLANRVNSPGTISLFLEEQEGHDSLLFRHYDFQTMSVLIHYLKHPNKIDTDNIDIDSLGDEITAKIGKVELQAVFEKLKVKQTKKTLCSEYTNEEISALFQCSIFNQRGQRDPNFVLSQKDIDEYKLNVDDILPYLTLPIKKIDESLISTEVRLGSHHKLYAKPVLTARKRALVAALEETAEEESIKNKSYFSLNETEKRYQLQVNNTPDQKRFVFLTNPQEIAIQSIDEILKEEISPRRNRQEILDAIAECKDEKIIEDVIYLLEDPETFKSCLEKTLESRFSPFCNGSIFLENLLSFNTSSQLALTSLPV